MQSKEYENNKGRFADNKESAKKAGAKGGKASGASRRKKRQIREAAITMLESEISDISKEKIVEMMPDINTDDLTTSDLVAYGLISSAINGNAKAFSTLSEIQKEKETVSSRKKSKSIKKQSDFIDSVINDPQYETLCDIDKKAVEAIANQADTLAAMISREQELLSKEDLIEIYDNGGGQKGTRQNPRLENLLSLQKALSSAIADIRALLGMVEEDTEDEEKDTRREEIINVIKQNRIDRTS